MTLVLSPNLLIRFARPSLLPLISRPLLVPPLASSLQEPIRKRLPEMTLVRDIKMILSRAFKIDPANQVKMGCVLYVYYSQFSWDLRSTSCTNNNFSFTQH